LASVHPTPQTTVYASAKAGVNALTLASAAEFASVGVRVNAVVCGTFDTDATTGLVRNPDIWPLIVNRIALRRVGQPEEVLGAVLYFLSQASSYTTGSMVTVDGGAGVGV
jgi:NAD(P)-dependent dehydrogenase (short-subunit alcohol dehydrogenase family)